MRGVERAELVRRGMALVHSQAAVARQVARHHATRLHRHDGLPVEAERGLDYAGSVREQRRVFGIADIALVGEIASKVRMGERRVGLQRAGEVAGRRQQRPLDLDQLDRVLRQRAALCHDRDDGLTHEHDAIFRQRILRAHHQARIGLRCLPALADRCQIGGRHDPDHTGQRVGLGGADGHDAGMRVRRAQEGHMQHARHRDIVDIGAAPADKQPGVAAPVRGADRPCCRAAHGFTFAAAATASTIAS